MSKTNGWRNVTSEEAYQLSQAEFKGMVIEALQNIREDVRDLKNYNNNTRYISMTFSGVSGVVSGIMAALGLKTFTGGQ